MENISQNQVEQPKEDLAQEQELLKETPVDEVRKSIIDEYGLNEDIDGDLIEKLANKQLESNKKLSTAIKQKIGWRTKAEAKAEEKTQVEQKKEDKPQVQLQPKEDVVEIINQKVEEKLEEKELDSLDLSDELKSEIKNYAKATGLKISKVLKTDYFNFLKEKEENAKKVEKAGIGGKRNAPSTKEFSLTKPPKPDMSTKEGIEEWEAYEKWRKTQ